MSRGPADEMSHEMLLNDVRERLGNLGINHLRLAHDLVTSLEARAEAALQVELQNAVHVGSTYPFTSVVGLLHVLATHVSEPHAFDTCV